MLKKCLPQQLTPIYSKNFLITQAKRKREWSTLWELLIIFRLGTFVRRGRSGTRVYSHKRTQFRRKIQVFTRVDLFPSHKRYSKPTDIVFHFSYMSKYSKINVYHDGKGCSPIFIYPTLTLGRWNDKSSFCGTGQLNQSIPSSRPLS